MSEVPQALMAAAINRCFEIEGLPKCIKIDNGEPLVYPAERDLPTLTVLWWIGLGIEVIYNKPRCPQQNGTIEGLQGICSRWSDPARKASIEALQSAVNEANRIQRCVYRIRKQKYQTRMQLYPQLATNPRRFDLQAFDFHRVKVYLAQKVWQRKVKKNGCIKLYKKEIYVALHCVGQSLTVTYDPVESQWVIRAANGTLLKTSTKALITEEMIFNHVNMSRIPGVQLNGTLEG